MTGSGRRGAITLEILVGVVLFALLAQAGVSTLQTHVQAARAVVVGAETQEAVRLSRWILGSEVRAGIRRRDWELEEDGSLRVRAFRGTAVRCGPPGADGAVPVRFRALRAADPEKDSVLILLRDGRWRPEALENVLSGGGGECAGNGEGEEERWRLSDGPSDWLVARLFETGTYHLEDRALRFRRGAEGRQPLVVERFGSGSGFRLRESGLGIRIEDGPAAGRVEPLVHRWTIHPPEG